MEDDLDQPLMFETLAASLEIDRRESKTLVESLATMLQGALPDNVTVTRGGWLLSKEKPIEDLLVRFDDTHYQITKDKRLGSFTARSMKVVRGIALKSTEMELSECISQIVKALTQVAEKNTRMKDALRKFVEG